MAGASRTAGGKPKRIDLVAGRPLEYSTPDHPTWIRTARGRFVRTEGNGPPGGSTFQSHLRALYGVAYTLKFRSKAEGRDFRVPPLEGRWWVPTVPPSSSPPGPTIAHWQLRIPVPPTVTARAFLAARAEWRGRSGAESPVVPELVTEPSGWAVQMLHLGPYADESGDLGAMRRFAREGGARPDASHLEVYLSDPRRVPPARLRTILRVPVRLADGARPPRGVHRPTRPARGAPQRTTRRAR